MHLGFASQSEASAEKKIALALDGFEDFVLWCRALPVLHGEPALLPTFAVVCKCWRDLICSEAFCSELWQYQAKKGTVGIWQ